MAQQQVDIFVIGGGINGCGIARDAAGRGYSVFLAEMNDLGSGTSSFSTKLIHGGLRYLEHYEFRLVHEALKEREVLWQMAPHIIWPLRFVLPYHKALRPAWLLRLGLFLYDHIGGRKKLPATRVVDLQCDAAGAPLKADFAKAFEYSDCWVNDARLVVLNAMDAADRGAIVKTRTKVISAKRVDGFWTIITEDQLDGAKQTINAKFLVNASGPWVDVTLGNAFGRVDKNVRLVKGSHIVIKKKFEHERAYIFQNGDGRIIFAIPYEFDFTLVGTTDQDFDGDPSNVKISKAEIDYLCQGASEYFKEPVRPDDIVWDYCGVRPLYDDGASKAQEITRDYVLKVEGETGAPRLVNIFGGKITTYRRLAEAMLEIVEEAIGLRGKPWTKGALLPGGDFPAADFAGTVAKLKSRHKFLEEGFAIRLVRLYGTKAWQILGDAKTSKDLGRIFGPDLSEAEIEYLIHNEWALTAEDVLWRRTKRGLRVTQNEVRQIERFMAAHINRHGAG